MSLAHIHEIVDPLRAVLPTCKRAIAMSFPLGEIIWQQLNLKQHCNSRASQRICVPMALCVTYLVGSATYATLKPVMEVFQLAKVVIELTPGFIVVSLLHGLLREFSEIMLHELYS